MTAIAPTRLFPMLVALALAIVSYALERAVREAPLGPEPRRHDPDYIVERFVLSSYGTDGAIATRFTAEKMLHYPDDGTAEIIAPRAQVSKPKGPHFRGRSDRAVVADDGEEAFFYGNVQLVREADARRAEARLETQFLHLIGGNDIAQSDREVRMQEGASVLAGRGMVYHRDTGEIHLREHVRGSFAPRTRTPE
jgi:lipopolysaccharide export system protein LptC